MTDPTQAPPDPPTAPPPPEAAATPDAAATPGAAGTPEAAPSPGIQLGLLAWLGIVTLGGVFSLALGHADSGVLFVVAGVFALAQSTDAAVVLAGYREWVRDSLPRRSVHGVLFRLVVRSILPVTGAVAFAGFGTWALTTGSGASPRLAAAWCAFAALISLSLVGRTVADFVTRLLFGSGAPGRTRRLTARIAVLLLLLPVPARLMGSEIMASLRDSGTALIDPPGLVTQLFGEIAIALAGVGLFVRRDWSATRERLGLVAMRPSHLGVLAAGLVAAIGLNTGMTSLQQHVFPRLWNEDAAMVQLMSSTLPVWTTLLLGVSAGFGEEILFRGALQPRLGVAMTALLFACLHVQYSWFGMLTVGALGVLLGVVRSRTNTTTAVLVHGLYDIFAALTSGT